MKLDRVLPGNIIIIRQTDRQSPTHAPGNTNLKKPTPLDLTQIMQNMSQDTKKRVKKYWNTRIIIACLLNSPLKIERNPKCLAKKFPRIFRVCLYIFSVFLLLFLCIHISTPTKKTTHEKEKQINKLNELLQTLNIFSFDGIWKHSDL